MSGNEAYNNDQFFYCNPKHSVLRREVWMRLAKKIKLKKSWHSTDRMGFKVEVPPCSECKMNAVYHCRGCKTDYCATCMELH